MPADGNLLPTQCENLARALETLRLRHVGKNVNGAMKALGPRSASAPRKRDHPGDWPRPALHSKQRPLPSPSHLCIASVHDRTSRPGKLRIEPNMRFARPKRVGKLPRKSDVP